MATQEKSEKAEGAISRRAFVGLTAAAGVAAGFLVGWLIKPAEVAEGVITQTLTSTVTRTTTTTAAGATATVTATAPGVPVVEEILPLRRVDKPYEGYHLVFDYNRCTGCRLCEFECAMRYQPADFPGVNLEYSRIRVNRFCYVDIPLNCRYCHLQEWVEGSSRGPCQEACPYDALVDVKEVQEEDKVGRGYRWVDPSKCVGLDACGKCLEICEEQFGSGVVFLPPDERGVSLAAVCTMCAGKPACVNACPEQTIRFEAPTQDGRYYAHTPTDLAELLFMKLYKVKKELR